MPKAGGGAPRQAFVPRVGLIDWPPFLSLVVALRIVLLGRESAPRQGCSMNRILAIQVKQIGDVLLTLPALRVLRRNHPDAHITVAVSKAAEGLAQCFACVDEVVGVGQGFFEPSLCSRIGAPCFDISLDFSGTDRALFLSLLCGSHTRAGYDKHTEGFFRSRVYTHSSEAELRKFHTVDYFTELLRTIDIEPEEEPLSVTIPQETLARGKDIVSGALRNLGENPDTSRIVVIHPGTARSEKYWAAERWAEVITHIAGCGFVPFITGASGEEELSHLERIKATLGDVKIADMVGKLSLLESASVIAECDAFLGVDTAAMHLASALQKPTVALFGPTSPYRWRPRHEKAVVLISGQDGPGTRYKPDDEAGDMMAISTRTVISAIDSLLAKSKDV